MKFAVVFVFALSVGAVSAHADDRAASAGKAVVGGALVAPMVREAVILSGEYINDTTHPRDLKLENRLFHHRGRAISLEIKAQHRRAWQRQMFSSGTGSVQEKTQRWFKFGEEAATLERLTAKANASAKAVERRMIAKTVIRTAAANVSFLAGGVLLADGVSGVLQDAAPVKEKITQTQPSDSFYDAAAEAK